MSTLGKAIAIAAQAHANQFDKGDSTQPYILHPLRVMNSLATEEEKIVGVLHDVLEDTDVTLDQLREKGYSETILDALVSVTRLDGETYEMFILRARANEIGRKVKMADLKDNMNWDRIRNPKFEDKKRMQKYQDAYYTLL